MNLVIKCLDTDRYLEGDYCGNPVWKLHISRAMIFHNTFEAEQYADQCGLAVDDWIFERIE